MGDLDAVAAPRVRLAVGRRLKLGPPWTDDDAVLWFDTASGDYWVLSPDATRVLKRLSVGGQPSAAECATVEALISAGLLESIDAPGA